MLYNTYKQLCFTKVYALLVITMGCIKCRTKFRMPDVFDLLNLTTERHFIV